MASYTPRTVEVVSDDCLQSYEYVFQQNLLKNQVAFITGGGSGIGFRTTEILMRHGCDTAIASRNLDKVQAAAKKLEEATGRKCLALSFDVRDPKQVLATVEKIMEHYGKIDILVNNAAGNFLCAAENLSYNAFKTVLDIDTLGTFNVSKAVFEKYFKDHGGNIINISATLGYTGTPLQVHAGSAKAAIDAMTRHLSNEWGPYGVRVNCVSPGPIEGTEGIRRLAGRSDENQLITPFHRRGQKTEIADAIVYLSSNSAAYITGSILVLDGGWWMRSDVTRSANNSGL